MITLFSTCKPFTGIYRDIQFNAFRSWAQLKPVPNVVIFGDDEGTKFACETCGFTHIPKIKSFTFNERYEGEGKKKATKPSIPVMFKVVQELTDYFDLFVYVNSDILLTNLARQMECVASTFKEFLFVGQRYNVDVVGSLDFSKNWIEPLRKRGKLHPPCGIDYIGFTRGLWKNIPDFSVGYVGFDNYLVHTALERGIPVVDGTQTTLVFHQNHPLRKRKDAGDQHNLDTWGKNPWEVGGQISEATWILNEGGVWRK